MSESAAPTTPTASASANPPPIPGTFVWNEFNTNDLSVAGKFYTEVFGWGMDYFSAGGHTSSLFTVGKKQIGGLVDNPDPNGPPFWLSYVSVDDLEARCAKVIQLGGKIVMPITAELTE